MEQTGGTVEDMSMLVDSQDVVDGAVDLLNSSSMLRQPPSSSSGPSELSTPFQTFTTSLPFNVGNVGPEMFGYNYPPGMVANGGANFQFPMFPGPSVPVQPSNVSTPANGPSVLHLGRKEKRRARMDRYVRIVFGAEARAATSKCCGQQLIAFSKLLLSTNLMHLNLQRFPCSTPVLFISETEGDDIPGLSTVEVGEIWSPLGVSVSDICTEAGGSSSTAGIRGGTIIPGRMLPVFRFDYSTSSLLGFKFCAETSMFPALLRLTQSRGLLHLLVVDVAFCYEKFSHVGYVLSVDNHAPDGAVYGSI
ncbi:hypothetical protein R1sor_022742 [Riccia sorocarpa]|uniref:Uncharacterized protein n=1 Tax=Riccia sorocarpa TaxID=122646 RepID=A0ABD3GMH0_9MARC